MKKILTLLLVTIILATACIPVAATNAATLLHTNSFENTNYRFSGSMRAGYERSRDYAKTGSYSLKAIGNEKNTGGWLWIGNNTWSNGVAQEDGVVFENGKKYSIRFWAMTTGTRAGITTELYKSDIGFVKTTDSDIAIPSGSWGECVVVFDWTEKATTQNVEVLLKFGGEGDIYVDDLEIYEGVLNQPNTEGQDADFEEIVAGNIALHIYVDNSKASGGDGSITSPFGSIEAARDYVRTINDNMDKDIVVNLMGGTYEIADTIEFTDEDSGTNGHYVIYQPYGYNVSTQANVVLSGGKVVKGWTESEIAGVYKAPLDIDYVRNLYVNDKRAQRARYNSYVTPLSWWDDTENTISTMDGFIIPGGIIKNPEKATNLEVYKVASFQSSWAVKGKAQASGDNTIISFEQPYFSLHTRDQSSHLAWKATHDFRLENALEFLDEPGEWYHDADTKTLYYMPRNGENIESCNVIAPSTEKLLNIRGSGIDNRAENIIVRGFTFSHGANKKTSRMGRLNHQSTSCFTISHAAPEYQAAYVSTEGNIEILNAKNVSLTDNVIKHMGGVGVAMPIGVDNCEISGNAIYDISSSAVTIGETNQGNVSDWRIVPRNVHITNNVIGSTGKEYGTDPGIQGYHSNGLVVSHNELYDISYSGICCGWSWNDTETTMRNNVIEYNRIYDYGKESQDGGGIYTLGRQPNSVVRGNYIRSYEQAIEGLYHDEGSSGITSTNNVIEMSADSAGRSFNANSESADLYVYSNYATTCEQASDEHRFFDNYCYQGAVRTPEALSIRENAGLTNAYKSIRNKIDNYSEDNETVKRLYLQTEEQHAQTPANIKKGESLTLKTLGESFNGEISVLTQNLSYRVTDTSVLSISGNKVKALADGITTVTVTDAEGNSAMMAVTVGDEVLSLDVLTDKTFATPDELMFVNYRIKTKYTEYVGIPRKSDISSSDTSVVSVVTDGQIRTTGEGIATLSVNVTLGNITASGSANITVSTSGYNTFKKLDNVTSLTKDHILTLLGGASDTSITENAFVTAVATLTEREISEIYTNPTNTALTKEKMIGILADVQTNIYGKGLTGDSEIYYYTDRNEINPSLIPKVAVAYRNGLLSWTDGSETFNPKENISVSVAAEYLYRLVRPETIERLRMDGRFSMYKTFTEWLYTRGLSGAKSEQINYSAPGEIVNGLTVGYSSGCSGSVHIENGEMVHKVDATLGSGDVLIFGLNNIKFQPGKTYQASFKAKLSNVHANGGYIQDKVKVYGEAPFTCTSGTGTITQQTVTSSGWTNFSFTIGVPEGTIGASDIYIRLADGRTFALSDKDYDILFKDIVVTEVSDTAIASSTIADGETDVLTPMDSLYFATTVPIKTNMVTTDKFTLLGSGASITAVSAINDSTICVEFDNILPENTYKLTVSGISTVSGGFLNDSISWTTAELPYKKSYEWTFESTLNGFSGADSGITSVAQSADFAHSGSGSAKITTNTHGNMYVPCNYIGINSFETGKQYKISYWVYSPSKSVRTGMYKQGGGERVIEQVTIPAGVWTKVSGLFEPTGTYQNPALFMMEIFDNPGTCYVDDIEVKELVKNPVTVYKPNIFNNGVPVNSVEAGNIEVKFTILGGSDNREVFAALAQYGENNLMKNCVTSIDTVTSGAKTTVTISLPKSQNLTTKLFIMGKTSYEPYNDVIYMDKE